MPVKYWTTKAQPDRHIVRIIFYKGCYEDNTETVGTWKQQMDAIIVIIVSFYISLSQVSCMFTPDLQDNINYHLLAGRTE